MSLKRFAKFAIFTLCLALPALAQTPPSPGTHITVSKNAEDLAMHSTVQAAVNAAKPGQVIEILDVAEYKEQVTIDSTKHGITLRSKYPTDLTKPKIIWRDTVNQSPKNPSEAKADGDTPGTSGNFETCGALRVKRANGVTIDGITVDGGGAAPFAWPSVWNGKDDLAHGNAAITLVVAGGAVVRNCELRNAYIGLNVKDRNTGGVFGNPNPADNDTTIPLSGFGKVGNHLIEYNRIHGNSLGIFFESAWDLASSVRYNLIYDNFHTSAVLTWIDKVKGGLGSEANNLPACGAIMFKDMVYTPVAIYNNTFYNNKMNLIGHWKIGATHLLFNNIFGKSSVPVVTDGGQQTGFGNVAFMAMDMAFTHRQHNSVTSAYLSIDPQGQSVYFDYNCTPQQYDTLWVRDVTVWDQYASPEKGAHDLFAPGCPTAHSENMVLPGARLTGGAAGFARDANMRWLEMSKISITSPDIKGKSLNFPDLFQSTDPTNPKFLWPDWSHPLVDSLIKNKGWEAAGIRNADGKIADIGAISSNNDIHQSTLARIKPTGVIMISGTSAKTTFMLTLESGTMTAPKIKFLRWVSPLPEAANFGGSAATPVAANAIHTITPPAGTLSFGTNTFEVTLPSTTTAEYGFFEVIVEGKDANGQTVVSDVGFLPYRQLDYILEIKAFKGTTEVKEVQAGEAVTLRVTAYKRGIPTNSEWTTGAGTTPLPVDYTLFSDPTARMYETANDKALVSEPNLTTGSRYTKTYTVYFTRTGDETVQGAGVWGSGSNSLTFLGSMGIKVKPGVPDSVIFLQPIPKSQLGGATPPTISGTYPVEVQVRDKYGNPVDVAVPVNMVSDKPQVGTVQAALVSTDPADGIARFTAEVTGGTLGDIFDLTASISSAGASQPSDVASLRVGRPSDFLQIFYYVSVPPKNGGEDGGKGGHWIEDYDAQEDINALVGTRMPVWVKIRSADTIATSKSANVCVTASSPSIQFFASADGPLVSSGSYLAAVTGGSAQFWITSEAAVEMASLSASAKSTASCEGERAPGINDAKRDEITFTKPNGESGPAFVKGDGLGRPTLVEIKFNGVGGTGGSFDPGTLGAWRVPESVSLQWPGQCPGAPAVVSTEISYYGDTIRAAFDPAAFPEGYSTFGSSSSQRELVTITGAIEAGSKLNPTSLADSIGPLIVKNVSAPLCGADTTINPIFPENVNKGVTPDTLRLRITEALQGGHESLIGGSLFMVSDPASTDYVTLTIDNALLDGKDILLIVSSANPLVDRYWIKLNPGHPGLTDAAGNKPRDDNRWVQIFQSEIPPALKDAWYVTNDATGKVDFAYLVFDKKVLSAADAAAWFAGGKIEFNWASNTVRDTFNVTAANIDGGIILTPGGDTVIINLKTAFDNAFNLSDDNIMTGGNMNISVTFAAAKNWPVRARGARDRARPVLIRAVLQIGSMDNAGNPQPDTLIITYSETMNESLLGILSPVSISKGNASGPWVPVTVRPEMQRQVDPQNSSHYMVKYVVDNIDAQNGDWVKINEFAGVADNEGVGVTDNVPNVQNNPNNRPVALKVNAGDVNWDIKVKKNPFRDSTVIVMTPNYKGGERSFTAYIKLYDNMGKTVVDDTTKNNPGDPVKGNALEWVWKGRNKQGRVVGTGTYLFKAVCVPIPSAEDPTPERYNPPPKKIAFVRGWGGK